MSEATLAGPIFLQALLADEFEILQDRDQDGFADHIHLVFHYSPEFNDPDGWAELLNLNAVLAFQSLGLGQPLLGPQGSLEEEDRPVLEVLGKNGQARYPAELLRREPGRMQLQGTSPRAVAELLRLLRRPLSLVSGLVPAWRRLCLTDQETDTFSILDPAGRPLASIARTLAGEVFSEPGPTATASEIVDLLEPGPAMFEPGSPESRQSTLNLAVDLDSDRISAELGAALNDFIQSCVMQATHIRLPIASTRRPSGSGLLLRVREEHQDPSGWPLRLDQDEKTGRSLILVQGRSQAITPALTSWTRLTLQDPGGLHSSPGSEIWATRDILLGRGRRGAWAHYLAAAVLKGRPLPPAAASELSWLEQTLSRLGLSGREPERLAPVVREYTWSRETDVVRDLIRDLPPGQGDLKGLVLISKPLALRRSLQAELTGILREKGYSPDLEVLNAYKAGLSWLLETVWPALRSGPALEDVEMAYQPFQPGQGSLEMTSRWLQEIFPGPDLLAGKLGWDPEAVSLLENQDQSAVYRLRTRDVQGGVRQWEFSPRWRTRPYLSTNPEAGLVHPCCAGVKLCQGGRTLLDLDLPTDRDRFWERFQHEWLPLLDRQMRSRLQRLPLDKTAAPFWEEVRIAVCIQETDLRLGLDEERVCPLEALHEDLYFVLLAFFQDFAGQNGLPEYLHLGRIHPRVRAEGSGHQPWAELKASPMSWFTENPETVSGPCPVTGLSAGDGREEILFSCSAPQKELEVLCSLARSWGLDLVQSREDGQLRLGCASAPLSCGRTERASLLPPLPEDRYLQVGEIASWIADLGGEAVVHAFVGGHSIQGRDIHVLEISLPGLKGSVSRSRLRLCKSTLLINARHHANEISSTNAVLKLAHDLATTEQGREILKRVNVVLIPVENADGLAALEDMLQDGPDHKLHAARYNAFGVEWYADYFASTPRFPESRVKSGLWKKWLPGIVLDCHGIPSHEWEQPYSGYAPGQFRAYWLPRAFVYAVVPFLDDPGHPGHECALSLARRLRQAFAFEKGMKEVNDRFLKRYLRYARRREPGIFPDGSPEALTVLPPEKRIQGNNFGQQYWPVTWSEIVSEVTDEIASGPLLAHCSRAHRIMAGDRLRSRRTR